MAPPKYRSLTLREKKEVLEAVDSGEKKKNVAAQFGIAATTLSTILKQREKIMASSQSGNRKRDRPGKFPQLEECLIQWLIQCYYQNIPVNGPILIEKAKEFAAALNITAFNASQGWLDKFKKRKGLVFHKVCGASAPVDDNVCVSWENQLYARLREYEPRDVFNANEIGMYFKCLPTHTRAFENEKCHSGENSEERVTLLLAANMDGSEKLKPLMIGKFAQPRCFKNTKSFPLLYRANTKAWMTSEFFKDWLLQLNHDMATRNRKILLFIDNCTAHNDIPPLENIRIEFFPPNTATKLQPFDQGIFCNFKVLYRTQAVQRLVASLDCGQDVKISILDAVQMVDKAWRNITSSTIFNCFRTCGFVKDNLDNPIDEASSFVPDPSLLWAKIDATELPATFDEYVHFDNDLSTMSSFTDAEIINAVIGEMEDDEDASDIDEKIPSHRDATSAIATVRQYLQQNEDLDQRVFDALNLLENVIDLQVTSSLV